MEEEVLVFLYRREKLEDEEEISDGTDDYILDPVDILDGNIIDVDGEKIFYSKDGQYELRKIDNINSLDDQYCYAFPVDVTGYDAQNKNDTKEYMQNDNLFQTHLMQSYHKEKNKKLYSLAHNTHEYYLLALINPDDFFESSTVLDYDATEYLQQNGFDKKEKTVFILKYSDIENIEESKKKAKENEEKYYTTPHKAVKITTDYLYADELYDEIKKCVISQDEQIKAIATIFAKNQRIDNPYMKCNFILCGPTGVGKTEIFRQLAKIANVPMINEDANEFTAAGYVGRTVTEVLANLYNAADGDLKRAENGIILMDEIDKKAGGANDMEVTKGAVIQSLLKMIEGHTYPITVGKRQIYFDTSRVTFAFSGAFSGIEKFVKKKANGIGFGASAETSELTKEEKYNTYTLWQYGLLPEFIGRNRIIAMNDLKQADLERILKESDLSYLRLYRDYLKGLNMEFKYNNAVVKALAAKAIEEKTGARSLQSITEKALEVADYYIGSKNGHNYKELVITPKTVEDNKKFILR